MLLQKVIKELFYISQEILKILFLEIFFFLVQKINKNLEIFFFFLINIRKKI